MFNVKSILQEYSKEKVAKVHHLDSSHPSVHTQAQILLRFSWNLKVESFAKFCQHIAVMVNIK